MLFPSFLSPEEVEYMIGVSRDNLERSEVLVAEGEETRSDIRTSFGYWPERDDVTDRILLFGGYVGGAVLATLFAVTAPQSTDAAWLLGAAIIFALGFSAVTQPLTVLEASASTLFVTYAQVPEVLASTHPILFHRFQRLTEVFLHTRGHAAVEAVGVRPPRDLDDI